MGGAKGGAQKVAVAEFNSVLGARRGSAAEQARRDIAERALHAAVLSDFLLEVEALCGSHNATTTLIAFHQGEITEEQMREELAWQAASPSLREMATIIALGDPPLCPGLITPAVEALGQFFSLPHHEHNRLFRRRRAQGFLPRLDSASQSCVAATALIKSCFSESHSPSYYRHLQPLCEGLGVYLARQPESEFKNESYYQAARALQAAPAEALAGPFVSWVDVFAKQIDDEALATHSRSILLGTIFDRESDREFALAFEPIIERRELL